MNCLECGEPIIKIPNKRAKKFCNSTCRSNFWQKQDREKKATHSIYGLLDPIIDKYFYVGKTKNKLKGRLTAHIADLTSPGDDLNKEKIEYIRSLIAKKSYPKIVLLETIEPASDKSPMEREYHWVDQLKKLGHPITNVFLGPGLTYKHLKSDKKTAKPLNSHDLAKAVELVTPTPEVYDSPKIPKTLDDVKSMCPKELTGFDRSSWISTERQKYGI